MQEIINSIHKARITHNRWVGHALKMTNKIHISKMNVPKNHASCSFSKWYKDDQWGLSIYNEYQEIEKYHQKLLTIYQGMATTVYQRKKESRAIFITNF